MTPRQIKNFWAKVDKTPGRGPHGECWLWTGGVVGERYGRFVGEGWRDWVETPA